MDWSLEKQNISMQLMEEPLEEVRNINKVEHTCLAIEKNLAEFRGWSCANVLLG